MCARCALLCIHQILKRNGKEATSDPRLVWKWRDSVLQFTLRAILVARALDGFSHIYIAFAIIMHSDKYSKLKA